MITPENITELKENEIFVYGANKAGYHNAGAALLAKQAFGAVQGQIYLVGNTYGFCTKDKFIKTLSLDKIKEEKNLLKKCIDENPDKHFLITKVGCGLAGYTVEQIAPMFYDFYDLPNVSLPIEFRNIIKNIKDD